MICSVSTENLKKRIKEIEKQKEQAIAHINALCGAEQVLQELLADAEKEDNADG